MSDTQEDLSREDFVKRVQQELIGLTEIKDLLAEYPRFGHEVTKQYVFTLSKREDFPQPILDLAMGRMWLASDIVKWVDHYYALPKIEGRPPLYLDEIVEQWAQAYERGESYASIGRRYSVHPTTISRCIRNR